MIYHVSSEQYPSRTITWKAPQNKCPVIDYVVQYQLVQRDLCQEEAGEFETLHNITERQFPHSELLPNSIYKVRVLARNEAGLGEFQESIYIEYTTPEKGKFLVGEYLYRGGNFVTLNWIHTYLCLPGEDNTYCLLSSFDLLLQ